ncbi:unnamed protein product, partial [Allacma fusca]
MFNGLFTTQEKKGVGLKKREILTIGLALLVYYAYIRFIYKPEGPTINISTGNIRGSIAKSRTGLEYYEFLGIPYAKPPVGQLRFEPPQPAESWTGVRDASRYGAACLQLDIVTGYVYGREDCLFINVFVP